MRGSAAPSDSTVEAPVSTTQIPFVPATDRTRGMWLAACEAHLAGRWEEAAHAWAALAQATPAGHRQDIAVYWQLAGTCAERARS